MSDRKAFPAGVTSYDLIKTMAVIFMIVDHVGFYFHDGQDWYRVIGRLCVPIWFFLIGYARTREQEARLWIGTAILEAGRFACGLPVLPLTVLGVFLILRACIDRVMHAVLRNKDSFWQINIFLFMLVLPSLYVLEYGTLGLFLAMFGWMARQHQDGDPRVTETVLHRQMGFSVVSFILWETLTFAFNKPQMIALSAGVLAIAVILLFFRARVFPAWNRPLLTPARWLVQFCGRWTLEIYVAHVIAFQTVASVIDPHRFPAFTFLLIPQG